MGSRLTGAMGSESNTYSDALCLALHAISVLHRCGYSGANLQRQAGMGDLRAAG